MKNKLKLFFSMVGIIFILSPILAHGAFPIATTIQREMSLSMAFDGTNYLVGIQGDQYFHANITAQLLSQTGTLIGDRISTGRSGGMPLVAFDGTNYLLIWADDADNDLTNPNDIYGQLIDTSGAKVGSPFLIAQNVIDQKGTISLAFDGGNYLVIWTDARRSQGQDIGPWDIYGQLVSKSGALVGSQVKISGDAGKNGTVAFDGNNYLVVWNEDVNDKDIHGHLVSPSGILVGSELVINANEYFSDNYSAIAFDGTNYLVVWLDEVGGYGSREWDIFGQLIDKSGDKVGGLINVSTASGYQFSPQMAFDGTNYLITWTDMRNDTNKNLVCDTGEGTCVDIYGQYINKSGILSGTEFIINSDESNQYVSPVIFANGKYLCLWTSGDWIDGTIGDVYGQFIPKARFEEFDPAISYTGTWNHYSCTPCSGGALKYSKQTGAKAEFSFNGTGIKWIVAKGPMMGKARVYLDGVNKGLIDLYSATTKVKQVLQATGLAPGNHTVVIEVSGQQNTSATDKIINIDAFEVAP